MKKIIAFILCTACLLFSACSLNEISSQNNNSSTNTTENSSNTVPNNNSTQNNESSFENENVENNSANNNLQNGNNNSLNNPFEIAGSVFGGYIQPDVSGDPLPSSMIAYRVQESAAAIDRSVAFEIAISDVSFTKKEPIRYQEPLSHLTITVANLANEAEETVLETLTKELFSSQSYGYQIVKDEKDNKWINYDNYVTYNIPSTLLIGEKGILLFKVTQYYPPNSLDCATAAVYYKYQDGKIYFSNQNMESPTLDFGGISSGDYQATNTDEMSPYLVGYEVETMVSYIDTLSIKIAPSLISFPVDADVDVLKLMVRFSDGKELLLDVLKAESFTQELYGCTINYNDDGYISQVEYHSFKEYFIPLELLSNEGWLSFELWSYTEDIRKSGGFAPTLYYAYRNNTLYFSI